jgi:hypothetical protein
MKKTMEMAGVVTGPGLLPYGRCKSLIRIMTTAVARCMMEPGCFPDDYPSRVIIP